VPLPRRRAIGGDVPAHSECAVVVQPRRWIFSAVVDAVGALSPLLKTLRDAFGQTGVSCEARAELTAAVAVLVFLRSCAIDVPGRTAAVAAAAHLMKTDVAR
jgi:hypothetical protein